MADKSNIEKRKIGGVSVDWDMELGGPVTKIGPYVPSPDEATPAASEETPFGVSLQPQAPDAPASPKEAAKIEVPVPGAV